VSYEEQIEAFRRGNGSLAFTCITDRNIFANALKARADEAWQIQQGDVYLCGPAAFMYCIAKDRPADYVRYVLSLAENGIGELGNKLVVKPSRICRNASLSVAEKGSARSVIDPVDWVALASLRDNTNTFRLMGGPRDGIAGITLGGDMADWFRATGWFHGGVSNSTNLSWSQSFDDLHDVDDQWSQPLKHLCGIEPRINGNGHVCLLIRSEVLYESYSGFERNRLKASGRSKKWRGFPNHWVVLDGHICLPRSATPDHMLNFNVWTWGRKKTTINMTVLHFLPCYYGYVSAIRS